jgi:phosphate transport system substrate-binding protein
MLKYALALLAVAAPLAPRQDEEKLKEFIKDLPSYSKVDGVSGNLNSMGSDTMNNMMTQWAEGFRRIYPNVNIGIEGKGSNTAPTALQEGTAQLGPMSREAKSSEQDKFEGAHGYKMTQLRPALDALAVYVNKDNPLNEITLEQVDAIYSKGRKKGYKEDLQTWGQLGLAGDWANRPISTYGRNSASGTYGFFKEVALGNGDYKDTVKEQPGSAAVVVSVTDDRYGIGYSGIGYSTSGVKKLRIAEKKGKPYIAAEAENVYNDTYPLRRFLFVYINKPPGKPLSPLLKEFCTYMMSKEGQEVVIKDGYFPVPPAVAAKEVAKFAK